MGLPNFGSPAEGVLPLLVMNTVMSVAVVKNKIISVLHLGGGDQDSDGCDESSRVSITRCNGPLLRSAECCVCLCGFEAEEEVSELISCKHVFHRGCLDKWFHSHHHVTCPLCRSTT